MEVSRKYCMRIWEAQSPSKLFVSLGVFSSNFGQSIPGKSKQNKMRVVPVKKIERSLWGVWGAKPHRKILQFIPLVFAKFFIKNFICKIFKKGLYFSLKQKVASGGGQLLHKDGKILIFHNQLLLNVFVWASPKRGRKTFARGGKKDGLGNKKKVFFLRKKPSTRPETQVWNKLCHFSIFPHLKLILHSPCSKPCCLRAFHKMDAFD